MAAQGLSDEASPPGPKTLSFWKAQCQELHVKLSEHCTCYYEVHWTSAFVWELDYDEACGIDTPNNDENGESFAPHGCPFCSRAEHVLVTHYNSSPTGVFDDSDISETQGQEPAAVPSDIHGPGLDSSQSDELNLGGYDAEGYDVHGYDSQGYDLEGFDAEGFNAEGYDVDGYDAEGYDVDGYDAEGYDAEGFDVEGYDAEGFDAEGLDAEGFDMQEDEMKDHEREDLDMEDHETQDHEMQDYEMEDYETEGHHMGDHDMDDYSDDLDSDDSFDFSSDEESFEYQSHSDYHPGWTKDLSPSLNPKHSTPPEVMKWVAWPTIYDSLEQTQCRINCPLRKTVCVKAALTHVDFIPLADYKFPYGATGKLRPLPRLPRKK